MSQRNAKTLRRIDRSNTNLSLRMARLEADCPDRPIPRRHGVHSGCQHRGL